MSTMLGRALARLILWLLRGVLGLVAGLLLGLVRVPAAGIRRGVLRARHRSRRKRDVKALRKDWKDLSNGKRRKGKLGKWRKGKLGKRTRKRIRERMAKKR